MDSGNHSQRLVERAERDQQPGARKPKAEYQLWGHTGEVYGQPDLVTTDRHDWFQQALARLEPALRLGWSRHEGLWCVWRTVKKGVRFRVPELDGQLVDIRRVPAICKFTCERGPGGTYLPIPPDETFLKLIYDDLMIGAISIPESNAKWASRYMMEQDRKERERGEKQEAEDIHACV